MATRARQEVSQQTLELSRYIAGAARMVLPRTVVERARIHVVDTFAAMISGSRLLPGQTVMPYVRTLGGRPEAGLAGTRIVTSAAHAALANGMFGHADETDDTHPPSLTHPGTSVVPAALAIGRARRAVGRPGGGCRRQLVVGELTYQRSS